MQYLEFCVNMADPAQVPSGLVPQTVFWVVDNDTVVGMIKLRHYLNDKLLIHGGHIGYYIHSGHRGRGLATCALALALDELRKLGEKRALITVKPDNAPSLKVVERNGGVFSDVSHDPLTNAPINRYWIEL